MNAVQLRLLYIFEFLISVPAVYTAWSQIGGQGHLDLMPWYWKLILGLGWCWAVVRLTAAVVERERAISRRSAFWFLCVLLLAGGMAGLTYYYHVHEVPEEAEQEDSTTAALVMAADRCQV